jgi:hypothetical protein
VNTQVRAKTLGVSLTMTASLPNLSHKFFGLVCLGMCSDYTGGVNPTHKMVALRLIS